MPGCKGCHYLYNDGEWSEWYGRMFDYWVCEKRPQISNLKTFPFRKNTPKCFVLSFWSSEFANEIDYTNNATREVTQEAAIKKWEDKYFNHQGQ